MQRPEIIAVAQILLSAIFLVGYFTVLYQFMVGNVRVPLDWKDTFQTILGVLTGGVGVILAFWFSRSRTENPT